DPSVSLGYADVKDVFPERSHLKLDFRPRTISNLYAKPISLPTPKMAVYVHGDEESVKKFKAKETEFVNILFTDTLRGTKYNIRVEENGIYTYFNHTNELIYGYENYLFDNNVKYTIDILGAILRWENGVALQNRSTKLSEDSIDFVLTDANEKSILTDAEIVASNGKALKPTPNEEFVTLYTDKNVDDGKVKIFLKAQHRCNQKLYFALAYFSEEFGIEVYRNEPVDKNQDMITLWGEGKSDFLFLEDEEEYHDVFKLIVSTEPISSFLIEQEAVDLGRIQRDPRKTSRTHAYKKLANDWFTKTIHIRLLKRKNEVSETATQLGNENQLVIGGHPSFKAKLSLSAAQTNSRNIDSFSTAAEVFSQQEGELLSFGATHGNNSNVLVLNDIAADEDLKSQPLEIDVNVPTSEEEMIWSFTYDNGVIVPIGEAIAAEDGSSTKIVIEEIPNINYPDIYNPDNPEPGKRSLTKALKLVFFKFIKLKGKTHQLRQVIYKEDGSAERSKAGLADAVQNAENILLLVHGIIGDTQQMAEAFRPAIEGDEKKYDLVLTYDYENLNTPIEETADLLYSKLVHDLNLQQSNKNLDIVAHSMGGLVSRYMIEKLKGDEFVRHLFMCGTPNAGSPIADVLDYRNVVIALLTLGINLGFSTPIAAGALGVLNKTKLLTVTLEQMDPEGKFIAQLKKTLQPKTQYTIIAGDLKAYREKSDDYTQGVFNKVLNRLSGFFHEDELNDIAVSMDSIKGVNHFNQPPPKKLEVACHHMNYFTDEGGFAVVREEIGC
ncbi:MAG: esterase/lipase family protein, partial [Chitinophagales bacterium]